MIQLAAWDTQHFGIKVGNLLADEGFDIKQLHEDIARSKEEGYDLLYLKGVELPETALNEHIMLADQKTIYATTVTDRHQTAPNSHVASLLHHDMTPELHQLALTSGKYSRYHTDKQFPPHVFPTLYRIWMQNSLNGTIATDVLAYMEHDVPIGIITYKQEGTQVTIGLVAVSPACAGKGIGTQLMQAFLNQFEAGTHIEVATQQCNRTACHFYEKNGFRVESVTNIYHIWNK